MTAGGALQIGRTVPMVLAMLVVGFIAGRWGNRATLGSSVLLMSAGIALCSIAPSYGILFSALLLAGFGEGVIEGLATPFVQDLHPKEPGRYINLTHSFWSVGVLATVLLSGGLLSLGVSWRMLTGVVALIGALAAALILIPARNGAHAVVHKPLALKTVWAQARQILKFPRFWKFYAAMFFADIEKNDCYNRCARDGEEGRKRIERWHFSICSPTSPAGPSSTAVVKNRMECIKQKALAGFDPAGHSESYIQTELVNPIYAPVIRQPIRLLITKAGLPVLHGGGEFCLTFWSASHIRLNFDASAWAGGGGVACFALAMVIGRMASGYFVPQNGLRQLIFSAAVLGTLVCMLLPHSPNLWVFDGLLFLAGLATSPFWPSIQSHATQDMPNLDSTMLLILLSCAGVPGCGFFTYLMGALSNQSGSLTAAFYLIPASYALIAILIATIKTPIRAKTTTDACQINFNKPGK
jgi:MFS family permease